MSQQLSYTASRLVAHRRRSHAVRIGEVAVGGGNPVVVQSMTTTPTQDVKATVDQAIRLAEAGCQIVRITAQNVDAARALKDIRREFSAAGFSGVPLVADIHFLPKAALEAAEHVEKVRVNPGNYADKKKFAVIEYSDAEYEAELQRLYEAFSPLVLKCRSLGRAMRIGTNHGSLSDRIMNRYGDTPMGMCESALEFLRIAESHGFRDIVISMKASNPKVMIQAYRLMVARMAQENMHYPLHLGVTEAGDGDDARIKSAIGIGSLLFDGLGDTIRVSLTEDPVAEIPVAQQLARKAEALWAQAQNSLPPALTEDCDPYVYQRRDVVDVSLGASCKIGPMEPPRVIVNAVASVCQPKQILANIRATHRLLREARIEGLRVDASGHDAVRRLPELLEALAGEIPFLVADLGDVSTTVAKSIPQVLADAPVVLLANAEAEGLRALIDTSRALHLRVAVDVDSQRLDALLPSLRDVPASELIFTIGRSSKHLHPLGAYRTLAARLKELGYNSPIWIRATESHTINGQEAYGDRLLDASILIGGLLCDGIGDIVSVETVPNQPQAAALAYNILQGARSRTTKTEYVACPSCGRTLFDLQTTTRRIREATGHLNGVTIAVMGCIVNGPGEMADADFGYVGGAPGKINLYVGKTPVKFNIPAEEAVDRLIDLIREHGKWVEPKTEEHASV